ncbi:MAG: HAMP domain-containing sensor histidine kinase [Sphingobacteriaceae bacterium]|nr:HAMP domain-containing sensor histidine kinase [Sphingobacteriaceae bacterium]
MLSIYYKKNNWKIVLLLVAIVIGAVSLYYTSQIVHNIEKQEKKKMLLWARATRDLSSNTDLDQNQEFLLDILRENDNIPVILTDDNLQILSYLNIDPLQAEKPGYLERQLVIMRQQHEPILIEPIEGIRQYIFFKDSDLLYQLRYYPYFQLAVISIFLLVSYLAFSVSRRYEQDFLWVGMAKETAHQLGTPISSLMAWQEYLKSTTAEEEQEMVTEVGKDIERLQTITERFSKIGSVPVLEPVDMREVIERGMGYMRKRASEKVVFQIETGDQPVMVALNAPLFDWVIENLTKNALDAMSGAGTIRLQLCTAQKMAVIDFTDSGKGIPAHQFQAIFKPGITTRKRGWGLGLTLVKRIIEKYHDGKIFVKWSEQGKGTTFRILLPLS